MRTYESTMAEIEAIQAEQRAITQKAEPSADDKAFLLKAEGELTALRKVANDLHFAEIEAAKAAAERAVPVIEKASGMGQLREALRNMRNGEEINLGVMGGEARALSTSAPSAVVPQEWHSRIEEYKFEQNWVRKYAQVVRTESTHNIPVLTANGTAAITGENQAYTNSEPTIGSVVLYAYKLTDKVLVSEELLADSAYDLEGAIARSIGYSFGKAELGYAMTGNGSSQPTGVFNKTADLTTDTQAVMTADEVLETIYGLDPAYRNSNCVFAMDNTMAYYLSTIKTPVTTSGGQDYQFPSMLNGVNPSIFGYGVEIASAIADKAAAAKVLAFGDFSQYLIGERGPLTMKRLDLSEYQTTFAFAQRFDSKPLNPAAFYVVALHA